MNVELLKCKLNKTYKDKKGVEKNIYSISLRIGNRYIPIKPRFEDDYAILDAFCEFVDLTKKNDEE